MLRIVFLGNNSNNIVADFCWDMSVHQRKHNKITDVGNRRYVNDFGNVPTVFLEVANPQCYVIVLGSILNTIVEKSRRNTNLNDS